MAQALGDWAVGRVSYSTHRDSAVRAEVEFQNGEVLRFGRGADCEVRFGHAPVRDQRVPRMAGRILVVGERAVVESPERATKAERASLRLTCLGYQPQNIAPGAAYAPPGRIFSVHVAGELDWVLDVVLRSHPGGLSSVSDDTSTAGEVLELSSRDMAVLLAYSRPLLRGGLEPATHSEAGRAVGVSFSTARRSVDTLLDRFYAAGLRIPDARDSRIALVHAAIDHGLLDPERSESS